MPSAWTIKPERHILIIYVLLALLLVGELLMHPFPDWRAKAERFALTTWPVLWARTAGGNYASSDRFLMVLGLNQPSETLVSLMAELPPDETAVFVGPATDPSFSQLYFTFSYLSWPHQIAVLGCGTGSTPPDVIFQPRAGAKVTRAFFYMQPPPSRLVAESRTLGPRLKLVQIAKGEEWTSSCLQ